MPEEVQIYSWYAEKKQGKHAACLVLGRQTLCLRAYNLGFPKLSQSMRREACCDKLPSERHRIRFGTFRKGKINEKAIFMFYVGIRLFDIHFRLRIKT